MSRPTDFAGVAGLIIAASLMIVFSLVLDVVGLVYHQWWALALSAVLVILSGICSYRARKL